MQPMLRAKPLPMRRRASESRAWTVALKLRGRSGWRLEDAFFQRSWSVNLGEAAFETSAHVSFFFDARGMVIAVTPSFAKAANAPKASDALESLRSSLGDQYYVSPPRDSLWTKVRSDKPTQLLANIAHVERIFGGPVTSRHGPSPRSLDDRRWYVVEALRASSWVLGSLGFCRSVGHQQRVIAARIGVQVDAGTARPGISAHFAGWVPQTNKRWTQFCDDVVSGLTKDGFRLDEKTPSAFSAGRWFTGINAARALKQADLFDELIGRGGGAVVH